jgi:hypothetical protein
MNGFHAGTGSTPNSAAIDGTYSQSGTTVVRVTGTGTFVAGNVNDFIKFATGERAKIVSVTNSVTVEVDRSQTVAAAALTIFDTSRTLLDAWAKATSTADGASGASGFTQDTDAGTARMWNTMNFAVETVAATYTEVGVTPSTTLNGSQVLFSRVVLDSPVNVGVGQFLQLRFELLCVLGNYRTAAPITMAITGWPYTYNIQSITSNGTSWDVVLNEAVSSHYAAGRPITIAGAEPVRTNISSLSSTGSDFTVNATAHGRTVGQSIVIAGATPSAYNGTWVVATVPNANSMTVTSAINPGSGSGGTVRLVTPGTWYNGTHTIASFPNSTTIRITNAASIPPAGVAGTVKNSLAASGIICGVSGAFGETSVGIVEPGNGTQARRQMGMVTEANMKTGLQYGVNPTSWSFITSVTSPVAGTYDSANRKRTFTVTFPSANQNSQTIRQLVVGDFSSFFVVTFDERQRKENGFQMVLNFTVSWEPALD